MQGHEDLAGSKAEGEGLRGISVLVTEDDLFVAMDLAETLTAAGAAVVGPVSSTERAIKLLKFEQVDAAVLDISLAHEFVFPLAEILANERIPFLFASGCDPSIVPEEFAHVPLCEKPVAPERIVSVLSGLIRKAD